VIEDDIENHFNTGPVQRLHHVSKFMQRPTRFLTGAVCLVRGKK
jgi:hypothetical protein